MNSISITINTVAGLTYVTLSENFKKTRTLTVSGEPVDAEAVVELVKKLFKDPS